MKKALVIFSYCFLAFSSLGLAANEDDMMVKQCESSYSAKEKSVVDGYTVETSPNEQIKQSCSGKVGPMFCEEEAKKEFIKNCVVQKKQEFKSKVEESLRLKKAVEALEKTEKD